MKITNNIYLANQIGMLFLIFLGIYSLIMIRETTIILFSIMLIFESIYVMLIFRELKIRDDLK